MISRIEYKEFLNTSIRQIDGTLSDSATGNNDNEEVFHIP